MQRSLISQLPDAIRAELDHKLLAAGFGDYRALAEWLGEQGYEISKSAVHRYGQAFEERLGALKIATEQARAIAEAAPDDEGLMGDALLKLVQQKAFDTLLKMEVDQDLSLDRLGRMVADLNRSAVQQKRWASEVREKVAAALAALEAEASQVNSGLDSATLQRIRTEIYGLV